MTQQAIRDRQGVEFLRLIAAGQRLARRLARMIDREQPRGGRFKTQVLLRQEIFDGSRTLSQHSVAATSQAEMFLQVMGLPGVGSGTAVSAVLVQFSPGLRVAWVSGCSRATAAISQAWAYVPPGQHAGNVQWSPGRSWVGQPPEGIALIELMVALRDELHANQGV